MRWAACSAPRDMPGHLHGFGGGQADPLEAIEQGLAVDPLHDQVVQADAASDAVAHFLTMP